MKKKIFVVVTIIVLFFYYTIISNYSFADDEIDEESDDIESLIVSSNNIDEDINLNSRIAVAYDRESGRVIWGKDENKKTAMASTTKIMTAIIVIENCKLNEVVEISQKAAGTGGSKLKLKKGDKITVNDLLYGLMLRSGNDSAVALAEYVAGSVENFAELMNNKAKELNLKSTHFVTPHGLDDPNHYTTAYELAILADYALKNEIFSKIVSTKNCTITINGYPRNICNTNELLGNYPGVYGVKTGFTNNAGRCLVTAVKNDKMDIITVVIQADTKKDRTSDSIKLIKYIFNNYEKVNVEELLIEEFNNWKNINISRININRAKDKNINIKRDNINNKNIIVNKSDINNIKIIINAIYNYEAPVYKGNKLGEINIYVKNELLEKMNIYFDNEIQRKSFIDYFKKCLREATNIL
ncbi:MAG: D-alanyl-D-alanine carboxypeptidase [Clostridia bacterium]|nr:D-alanyl-D-alanine carboxypeptidase [Clostridia bacterium]